MRLVLEGPGKFRLDREVASTAVDSNVTVAIRFCGVCSTDVPRSNGYAYEYPLVLGHEMAGRVHAVPDGVSDFSVGEKVCIFPLLPCFECDSCRQQNFCLCSRYSYFGSRQDGGMQSYLEVPSWNLLKIPEKVQLEDAALTEPVAVVIHAIRRFQISSPDTALSDQSILVLGGGFLSQILVQILIKFYAVPPSRITVVDRNQFKLDNLPVGVNVVLDCSEIESYYECCFEASGSGCLLNSALKNLAARARIVSFGNLEKFDFEHPNIIQRKELTLIGSWNSDYKTLNCDWSTAVEYLKQGFSPTSVVSHHLALPQVPAFISACHDRSKGEGEFRYIKGLIDVSSDCNTML